MSPSDATGPGGFYPGPQMIDKAFNDNLKPCLYLLTAAGDPYAKRWSPPFGIGLRQNYSGLLDFESMLFQY
jgi:hypothetical protein